jgi:acyl-homoserine-lactone acylase
MRCPDPPRAYSILAYGNSNREDSPYFYDQAELFADDRMKRVAFSEEEILGETVARYRPGEERRRLDGAATHHDPQGGMHR